MTKADFEAILEDVKFNDWVFFVGYDEVSWVAEAAEPTQEGAWRRVRDGRLRTNRCYLQVRATTKDNATGEPGYTWSGRKWFLSPHMTSSEVVQTALKAVLTAVEHEVREQFLYRGHSIFDPHYDLDLLVKLRARGEEVLDGRPSPGVVPQNCEASDEPTC